MKNRLISHIEYVMKGYDPMSGEREMIWYSQFREVAGDIVKSLLKDYTIQKKVIHKGDLK